MKLPLTIGLLSILVSPHFCLAQDGQGTIREEFNGELTEERNSPWIGYNDSYYGYMTEIPIPLKAGNKVLLDGSVTGKDRKIAMALLDPTKTMVAATKRNTDVKGSKLVVDEVSATGTYYVLVVSDRIGAFKLTVTRPAVGKPDGKTNPSNGEPKALVANETFAGELTQEGHTEWINFNDSYFGYITEIPVTLKVGQKITLLGKVTGKDRRIAMALIDPSGKMIAATKRNTDVGASKLIVEEVNASGLYHVRIVSDRIGAFTLQGQFPKVEDDSKSDSKAARLRKALAEAEAKQKAAQGKKDR